MTTTTTSPAISSSAPTPDELTLPPWVPIEGINNLRCVGGYPIAGRPGCVFRRSYLYRSAAPQALSAASAAKLRELGVGTAFDLRSAMEIRDLEDGASTSTTTTTTTAAATVTTATPATATTAAATTTTTTTTVSSSGETTPTPMPSPSPSTALSSHGLTHHHVPVFADGSWSPADLAQRWRTYKTGAIPTAYDEILLSGSASSFRVILAHILQQPSAPLLVHCTAGKDRTGVVVALILAAAGVEDAVIAREYALTARALEPLKRMLEEKMRRSASLWEAHETDDEKEVALRNILSCREESMLVFLHKVGREMGGAEKVLTELCGFRPEEVERIREALVEKA